MAQQHAGLEREGFNLQQRQLKINQDMINFNTYILAAQTAIGLTSAAERVGQIIGEKHEQQANLDTQTGTIQYQEYVNEAILNGYNPYVEEEGENGEINRRYAGYDGYVLENGKTLGEFKQGIIDRASSRFWTIPGSNRAGQLATNAFENIELDAQEKIANKAISDRQAAFDQSLTNAIEVFRKTGDAAQLDIVINSAAWMSDDQRAATRLDAERQATFLNIKEEAMSLAREQGTGSLEDFLADKGIDEDQRAEIYRASENARKEYLKPRQEALNETWEGNTAGVAGFSLGRVNSEIAALIRAKPSFERCENMGRYNDYMNRLTARKDQLERHSAGGSSGAAARQEAENIMANIYVQFNNNEIKGSSAISGINQLRELSPERAAQYEAKILGGGENPAAEQTYLALDGIIRANASGATASTDAREAYNRNAQDLRQAIFQAYYNGVRNEELTKLVEGYRRELSSRVLQNAFNIGNIGNSGLFGSADNVATAFAYHSNQGNLDLRYSERTLDARTPHDSIPLTVGGEKAERVMIQAAEHNMQWANSELEKWGVRTHLTQIDYERDENGDREGRVVYKGSDLYTYRVNADSENGTRYLERWQNRRWVRIDRNNFNEGIGRTIVSEEFRWR